MFKSSWKYHNTLRHQRVVAHYISVGTGLVQTSHRSGRQVVIGGGGWGGPGPSSPASTAILRPANPLLTSPPPQGWLFFWIKFCTILKLVRNCVLLEENRLIFFILYVLFLLYMLSMQLIRSNLEFSGDLFDAIEACYVYLYSFFDTGYVRILCFVVVSLLVRYKCWIRIMCTVCQDRNWALIDDGQLLE